MKKILLPLVLAATTACAQKSPGIIDVKEVRRIESVLASDEMNGRRAGTPDIDRAAEFIAAEFKKAGLEPFSGNSFLQAFTLLRPRLTNLKTEGIEASDVIVITTDAEVKLDEGSGFEVAAIAKGENLGQKARGFLQSEKNLIVLVDTSFSKNFHRLASFKGQMFKMSTIVVFVSGNALPEKFSIKAEHKLEELRYANVVGMIPGKSKKNEYVIFSAHYDHLGVGRPVDGDSIYNGANDDAAGTTAVILLADYFMKAGNNERTLIFVAFTAEEIGGFGSRRFSRQMDPENVMAMFNIEMIGTESKWGKNTAFITGYELTDMGAIMQKNLKGSSFSFHPDPYPEQRLFYRSDNATLARLGVPAHTISTAKMENEPYYHKPGDEVGTLDLDNMASIIEAIALSAETIISRKDTPSRIKSDAMK